MATSGEGKTLNVSTSNGSTVVVSLENCKREKPFLGGFKHKLSGVEFHNASVQTVPPPRAGSLVARFDRDSQTVSTRQQKLQLSVDASTQMGKTGCFVSSKLDRTLLVHGVYETAADYEARVLRAVLTLQCYWRAWLARRYVRELRRDKLAREAWERQEETRRAQEREARAQREFNRRMNPRTREDFQLLYHALEMWRLEELERVNRTTAGPERKAALCELLDQEAQLIASIGRHKIQADKTHKQAAIQRFLDATAAPKRWTAYDGGITEMDTQFSLRAGQLRDIYGSLTMEGVGRDERLDILLTLKCTVKEHDCPLTRELVGLVDREADLLVRGLDSGDSLSGLRKRIAGLFFQYCKVPLFNPQASKHIAVPSDPTVLRANIYYCRSCCNYLPSTQFELSSNSRVVGHCRSCVALDNRARARNDLTHYTAMLRGLRHGEESLGNSTVAFIIEESDLRYLVENIWASQSALSGPTELSELVFVRWERGEQWSPWNTVLLTQDEGAAHSKLAGEVTQAYGRELVRKIHYRHILAKSYFSKVPGLMREMVDKVKELPLPRPKERVITV